MHFNQSINCNIADISVLYLLTVWLNYRFISNVFYMHNEIDMWHKLESVVFL